MTDEQKLQEYYEKFWESVDNGDANSLAAFIYALLKYQLGKDSMVPTPFILLYDHQLMSGEDLFRTERRIDYCIFSRPSILIKILNEYPATDSRPEFEFMRNVWKCYANLNHQIKTKHKLKWDDIKAYVDSLIQTLDSIQAAEPMTPRAMLNKEQAELVADIYRAMNGIANLKVNSTWEEQWQSLRIPTQDDARFRHLYRLKVVAKDLGELKSANVLTANWESKFGDHEYPVLERQLMILLGNTLSKRRSGVR